MACVKRYIELYFGKTVQRNYTILWKGITELLWETWIHHKKVFRMQGIQIHFTNLNLGDYEGQQRDYGQWETNIKLSQAQNNNLQPWEPTWHYVISVTYKNNFSKQHSVK
jgi:hypothetical protein